MIYSRQTNDDYMIRYTFLLAMVIILTHVLAARVQGQNLNAQKLLQSLAEKHNGYGNLTADFTFHYKNLQTENENQWNGSILMKGEKYKLKLDHSTIFYNGQTLWNYLHEANEVNISEPPKETDPDIINHPHQIFAIYKKDFKSKYLGEETLDGNPFYVIDLYPNDLDKEYSRIRLYLTTADIQIHTAKIFGKDGSRYVIRIDQLKPNQTFADSVFVFNKKAHPGVEVIDMRF